jgi:hypothetical protein
MSDAIFEAPLHALPELDEVVLATMAWHFSPDTGSDYWVGRVSELDFDPLTDVRCAADLALFDTVKVDWSSIPAGALIPRGSAATRFGSYESGGTTGAPKRIVDATSRRRNVAWQSTILDVQGFPRGDGGWLHIGPTGPHIMAKNITSLAGMRGFLPHFVDLDPRWAKRCKAEGRPEDFDRYLGHVLDQVRDVLLSQDIRAISSTPPVLATIAARPDVYLPLREKVRGVIWGGTSASPETLRLLDREVFPDAVVSGAYGNTMMGVAPQLPHADEQDPYVFRPFYPYSVVELVNETDPGRPVPLGGQGRVKITTLTRDLFVPPMLERDAATRENPVGSAGIELSGVRPADTGAAAIVEGVY